MSQCLAWDSKMQSGHPLQDLLPLPRASGKWHKHTHSVSGLPPLAVRPRHPEVSSGQGFFHSKGGGASQLPASQGFSPGPTLGECEGVPRPHCPWHPSIRTRSQQLNKVSFICDIQIQPMQKEITFPFDSSDNKLLKKKKTSRSLSSVSSKKTRKG